MFAASIVTNTIDPGRAREATKKSEEPRTRRVTTQPAPTIRAAYTRRRTWVAVTDGPSRGDSDPHRRVEELLVRPHGEAVGHARDVVAHHAQDPVALELASEVGGQLPGLPHVGLEEVPQDAPRLVAHPHHPVVAVHVGEEEVLELAH